MVLHVLLVEDDNARGDDPYRKLIEPERDDNVGEIATSRPK